ncbi:hypothetical protein I316_04938 [Kwoniella heveanensis BCC8398]|uniref:Uncharacterized protein n=1 Tax=Kwoniella heveanensis BCC8398 TaxID=1296120 RepID=A0A1B9GRA6_9TREE|nr:hypothetical protein I316_04938 [Kwoniella heveanensis BCC8398]
MELILARGHGQSPYSVEQTFQLANQSLQDMTHIEYTEDVTTKLLENMTLLEITESEDRDPFPDLHRWLQTAGSGIDLEEVIDVKLVTSRAAMQFISTSLQAHKEAHARSPAVKTIGKPFVNPLKNGQRRKNVRLTVEAIVSTPSLCRGKDVLPKACSELTQVGKVEHICLRMMETPSADVKAPDVEDVLDLNLNITSEAIEKTRRHVQALKDQSHPYLTIASGKVEEHPIWDKWERQAKATLQFEFPATYDSIPGLGRMLPFDDDSFDQPRYGDQVLPSSSAKINRDEHQLHRAYDSANLDYFGAPITIRSAQAAHSAEALTVPTK